MNYDVLVVGDGSHCYGSGHRTSEKIAPNRMKGESDDHQ
jgi:hypothetical protein